jgi:hypothetical protein
VLVTGDGVHRLLSLSKQSAAEGNPLSDDEANLLTELVTLQA